MIELSLPKSAADAVPGDRVRVIKPGSPNYGRTGEVLYHDNSLSKPGLRMRYDDTGGTGTWYHASVEMI